MEAPADTADAATGRTYTVQAGDSLWKIAEAMYGSGARYTAIFEANRDILDDPDRIHPGQELKIPDLED
ncbi:LysM peptidoglycan-binding domain-containing protein [Marinihelvus fidelis]|uniref:LysM peptidoglycan-binding domain-containing protein n=2 Tax=Marinihelvus fidelis TaxID=2613842 RepID=A0A5N0THK4_9GAMM|nr:LysM peptidoglycan-binding domain-containing protein [Marinihelvus fidelis]